MNRDELEHLIRAAGSVAEDDLVIVGSQAVLGTFPDAPSELLRSMEADMCTRYDPSRADRVDAAIGDGSQFHATFGIYAHAVGPETIVAPDGWEHRLVPVEAPAVAGRPARFGWCLEPHDLVLAKLAAGGDRDWVLAEVAIRHALVAVSTLRTHVSLIPEHDRGRCARRRTRARLFPRRETRDSS